MSVTIKKVAFTVYPVADVTRARNFYEKILGLKAGEDFGGYWQEYDIGGTTFAIVKEMEGFVKAGTQGGVAFEVSNLTEAVAELRSKGATFTMPEPMETPVCWMIMLKDPDGNSFALHQLK